MKTFLSVGIGLIFGIVIGIAASFKAAEQKAAEIIEEEIAEERRAMRTPRTEFGNYETDNSANKNKEVPSDLVEDDSESPLDSVDKEEIKEEYNEVSGQYKPSCKPYILEDMPEEFIENHKHLEKFSELNVVYDRKRGRVVDEDGCEIFDIKGYFGLNNLNSLFCDERFKYNNLVHIVNECNGFIFSVHAGDLYEYLDEDA